MHANAKTAGFSRSKKWKKSRKKVEKKWKKSLPGFGKFNKRGKVG